MLRRELLTIGVPGVVVAAASSCRRRPPSGKLRKIRVAGSRRLNMSNLHLAHELGYFREAGLDVEIMQWDTPQIGMALIAGGHVDVAARGFDAMLLNGAIRGVRAQIVAGRESAAPNCGSVGAIFALRKTFPNGLEDLRQLKGKRVAVGPAIGYTRFALDTHLERSGLKTEDVAIVSLRAPDAVGALLGGNVDAVVTSDDLDVDLRTLAADGIRSVGLARYYPGMQYSYIFFGSNLLDGDPDVGVRFLRAYLRGTREFIAGKTPRYMVDLAKKGGLDVERTVGACRDGISADGTIDMEGLDRYAEWAYRKNYTPRLVHASEIVDQRFLEKIRSGRAHARISSSNSPGR